MKSSLYLVVAVGIVAGAAAAVSLLPQWREAHLPAASSRGSAAIGGPFALTDTAGQRRSEKDFAGRPMIVFFGFTNCPDVCPSGLQILTVALDKLGEKSKDLSALFITVDPERDTPEALGAYLKSFHPQIIGLTGSAEDVGSAIRAYRVYAKKVRQENSAADYTVDHSSFFYLMDASGRYIKHFPHSVDADKLAAELQAVL